MNQQQRAVVQQALEAFAVLKMNDYSGYECTKHETDKIDDAETALRQLLEQQVQEPLSSSDVESFYKALAADERSKTFAPINWFQAGVFTSEAILGITTPPAQPDIAALVEGMEVSIDVSTGDHDIGNRLFGTVTIAQANQDSKHGLILLVQNPEANFAKPAAWVGLTEEQTKLLWHKARLCMGSNRQTVFKNLIEAHHGITAAPEKGTP